MKRGLPEFKYIAVTEIGEEGGRVHHHIVMSAVSMDEVPKQWEHGRTMVSKLDKEADYTGLSNYITKTEKKTNKKRWSQSRNLEKPIVKKKEIIKGGKILTAPKGYKLIQQEFYYSEFCGQVQYAKAIRIGGIDYAVSTPGKERMKE